jgi:chemotaxis protein MotA
VRHEEEYLCKMIISEGVQAIQSGDNPRLSKKNLTQLLPNSMSKTKDIFEDDNRGRKRKRDK